MKISLSWNGLAASAILFIGTLSSIPAADAKNICVGTSHSCFVDSFKKLRCWGSNASYQLGSLSYETVGDDEGEMFGLFPVAYNVEEVTCGFEFTCFRSTEGKIYCFGYNLGGNLGRGSYTNSEYFDEFSSPATLSGFTYGRVSSFRMASCAISDSSIYCWGSSFGLLYTATPQAITGIDGLTPSSIAVGDNHACFLDSIGDAYCWGDNTYGQLGISSTTTSVSVPTKVDLSASLSAISLGLDFTCVEFSSSGQAACFGKNNYYQLGDLTLSNKGSFSSDMLNLLDNSYLGTGTPYAGLEFTCVVGDDQGIYCIGRNYYGSVCSVQGSTGSSQFDYPPNNKLNIPLSGTIEMGLGSGTHQCATNGVDVYCWGSNINGQLGIESTSEVTSCTENDQLQKVCFDSFCDDVPCYYCGIPIYPFIGPIVFGSIAMLSSFIIMIVGCRKRAEFDNRTFLLPSGRQITGAQIWNSYSHPLGPVTFQQTYQQPTSVYAIQPAIPVVAAEVPNSQLKSGFVPNV